jgi:hypothetical protein
MALLLVVLIVRPYALTVAMHQIPFLRSMRWPFRECLQFQFFIHLFMIVRLQERTVRLQPAIALFSLAMFILPLPFNRVPTFNPLLADRQLLFSGEAEAFWAQVKTQLKPTDEVATVIDWNLWQKAYVKIPYTLACTANFPALYKIKCLSGYSMVAPRDRITLKIQPAYWFGAFRPEQVSDILAEKPDLKIIRVESVAPLKITIYSQDSPLMDLSPYLPKTNNSLQ